MAAKAKLWETVPSYVDLFYGAVDYVNFFLDLSSEKTSRTNCHHKLTTNDILLVLISAVILTLVRHYLTSLILEPWCKRFELTPRNQEKTPESAWKLTFYTLSWSFTFYLVVCKYQLFQRPSLMWKEWHIDLEIPIDMYFLLIMQAGFYVHSIYSVVFLDLWRKDSSLLIAHHLIAVIAIGISLAIRGHNCGITIIFLHDISDVFLEFSKLNTYFKIQSNTIQKVHDTISTIGFSAFTANWVIARLYWFPLKVIYFTMDTTSILGGCNHVLAVAVLIMWILLAMNIYWFVLILKIAISFATTDLLEDIREYDEDEPHVKKSRKRIGEENGVDCRNGNVVKITSSEANSKRSQHLSKRK